MILRQLALIVLVLGVATAASAYTVEAGDMLLRPVAGASVNVLRFPAATRATPNGGMLLGLDAEPVLLDGDRLDDVRPERLVAGLHVRHVEVVDHVRQQGQRVVEHLVPEEQRAAGRADEARSEGDVRDAVDDRLDDAGKILRVVLDRKSTRLNSSHSAKSRMPSSA